MNWLTSVSISGYGRISLSLILTTTLITADNLWERLPQMLPINGGDWKSTPIAYVSSSVLSSINITWVKLHHFLAGIKNIFIVPVVCSIDLCFSIASKSTSSERYWKLSFSSIILAIWHWLHQPYTTNTHKFIVRTLSNNDLYLNELDRSNWRSPVY